MSSSSFALALVLVASAIAGVGVGCSAGSTTTKTVTNGDGSDSGTTEGTDAGKGSDAGDEDASTDNGWAGNENIDAIFTSYCAGCHGTEWSSCWTVQENATDISSAVSSGVMPRGSTMAPADKSTLLTWLNAGAACSGTNPNP